MAPTSTNNKGNPMTKKVLISTAHNGRHQDFHGYELDDLYDYLDTFDYYESGTLHDAVMRALEDESPYIVEPVNGEEDLTIDFKYV
jgi:hypothetical protein